MNEKTVRMDICHPDALPDKLRDRSEGKGRIVAEGGKIYLKLDHTVVSCPDDPAGRELIYDLLLSGRRNTFPMTEKEELFYRILNDPSYIPDQAAMKRLRIRPDAERCAVVFHASVQTEKDLASVFTAIAPTEKGDILVPVDYDTCVFIRETDLLTMEELKEYTEAVIGTMESEGIVGIRAGIGNEADGIGGIRDSFYEGMEALSTGVKYHSRENVHLYSAQTLDRILESIPDEQKQKIRKALFGRGAQSGLSDEMLETVRVFFRNDLNLTAASRQLFIHRNTLNYRLDKIKKETGLDLRSFEDAVIFRIISGIPSDQ